MLYNEFVEGTGCRDNEHNYKVYRDLEIMYMNSDMSKAEIYEYGKKLVDNSESEEVKRIKADLKNELAGLREDNKRRKETIEYYKEILTKIIEDMANVNIKRDMDWEKRMIRENKIRINEIKFILGQEV